MRGLSFIFWVGCAACGSITYDISTTVTPDGVLERRSKIYAAQHPLPVLPEGEGWKVAVVEKTRTSTTVELFLRGSRAFRGESRAVDRLGRPSFHEVAAAELELGLLTIHRYQEVLADSVRSDARQKALFDAYAMGRELVFTMLETNYGREYDFSACRELLETKIDPLFEAIATRLVTRDPLGSGDFEIETCRTFASAGFDYCGELDKEARKVAARKFVDTVLLPCARGGARPLTMERLEKEGSLEPALIARFGSTAGFEAVARNTIADLSGAYDGYIFADRWSWTIRAALPGRIVKTNGVLDGADRVLWKFDASLFYGQAAILEAASIALAPPFAGREKKISAEHIHALLDDTWLAGAKKEALAPVRDAALRCTKGDPRDLDALAERLPVARKLKSIVAEIAPGCR